MVGVAAIECIESQPIQEHSPYVFPADVGDGHFIGVVRVLGRACAEAKLSGVTPNVLRHTFASIAGDLGFSELTIAGLQGHSSRDVTQRYVHLDAALVVAADQVSAEIAKLLDGEGKSDPRPASPRRKGARVSADAAASRGPLADDGDLRPQLVSV